MPRTDEQTVAELNRTIDDLRKTVEKLKRIDAEAATHVETAIVMRTDFTGDPPYVGWQGLGRALEEALDERDFLKQLCTQQAETLAALTGPPKAQIAEMDDGDDDAGC